MSDTAHRSWNENPHAPSLEEDGIDRVTRRERKCHSSGTLHLGPRRNAHHLDSTRIQHAPVLSAQDEEQGDPHPATHPLLDGTAAGNASEQERGTDLGSVQGREEQGVADQGVHVDKVLSLGKKNCLFF